MLVRSTWIFLACLCVRPTAAQSYRTHVYSDLEGLPSHEVYDVDQAPDGRIWVATRTGVAAFDGVEWEMHAPWTGFELEGGQFLACAADGSVFVVSHEWGQGFARYRDGGWVYGRLGPPEREVTDVAVLETQAGPALVLATLAGELITLAHDGSTWSREAVALGGAGAHGLEAHGTRVFVATDDGIVVTDGRAVALEVPGPASSPAVLGIAWDPYASPARLWAHGRDWIGYAEDGAIVRLDVGPPDVPHLEDFERVRLDPDGFGGLYCSYWAVLFHLDPERGSYEQLGAVEGLLGDGATDTHLDRQRNLWVANLRGVTRLSPRRFANYDRRNGLLEDETSAVLETASGEIVLGHLNGLSILGPKGIDTLPFPERVVGSKVLDLERGTDGELWVAASVGGLLRVRGRAVARVPNPHEQTINSVRRDVEGTLWIGTATGLYRGVESLSGAPFARVPVRRVFANPAGGVAIATPTLGAAFVDGAETRYVSSDDPDERCVFAVAFQEDGIWVGSRGGLLRVEGDALVRQAQPFGIEDAVYFICPDGDGCTWFGTERGVCCWDGQALRRYSVQEGLAGSETNRAGGLIDSSGRLWIGTSQGLSRYQPAYDLLDPRPPAVAFTFCEANGELLARSTAVRLGYQSDLVFGFRSVSFVGDGRPEYRCRLEGFDDGWLSSGRLASRQVRYTNLPAGSYRLAVQARNAGGRWGPAAHSPPITVTAPFWRRGWFVVVAAGLSGLVVFLVTSFFRAQRESTELQRLVRERSDELVRVEERYAKIFTRNRAAQVVVEGSSNGAILDINPAACALFGIDDAARGRSLAEVLGVDGAQLEELLGDASGSSRFVVSGGARGRDYEISACRYDLNGRAVVHAIVFDVTEQRRLQEQLQQDTKLKAIGQLAGGIAHDFNNLLTLILGYGDIVLDRTEEPETREQVALINEAGRRGAGLVGQLLAFSRRQVLKLEVLDLNRVLPETVDMLGRLLGETHPIRFEGGTEELCVQADRNQVERVVVNLAVNARDALPDGGEVRIRVGAGRPPGAEFEAGDFVELTVADRGLGMSTEVRERVLEPFYTTKEVGQGTGLGLPMVYGIVRQSLGELVVESAPGQGTTVRVYLPRVTAAGRPVDSPAERAPESIGGHTILFVEDDPGVRRMCAGLLRAAGHEVREAHEGEQALRLAESLGGIDLLLTDVVMPTMGGRELADRLRERWPELRVLFISGYSEEDLADQCGERCDFLQKPFTPAELSASVERLLHGIRARQEADVSG